MTHSYCCFTGLKIQKYNKVYDEYERLQKEMYGVKDDPPSENVLALEGLSATSATAGTTLDAQSSFGNPLDDDRDRGGVFQRGLKTIMGFTKKERANFKK